MSTLAVYARISHDAEGRAEGVTNQAAWGREYANIKLPDHAVRAYVDNDLSASAEGVHRPEYERLLADIEAGQVDAVWAVEQSRIARKVEEWFRFSTICLRAGINVLHTRHDGLIDLDGLLGGLTALISAHEARRVRQRVKARVDSNAAKGRPHGGRIFGFRRALDADGGKTLEIVPEQAAIVRECAERVLAGESLSGIGRDLTARGVTGAKGGSIDASSVKSFLTNPAVAGRRSHNGALVVGVWEPILDFDVWHQVRARLASGKAPTIDGRRQGNRDYLLSGLLRCECGRPLTGRRKGSGGRTPKPLYVCNRGCGASIDGVAVEDHLTDEFLARVDHLAGQLASDEHAERRGELLGELDSVDSKRAAFGVALADDTMDMATYKAARERLAERERKAQQELADLPAVVRVVDAGVVRASWDHLTVPERRDLLRLFVPAEGIRVRRAKPGRSRLGADLSRVELPEGWS